MEVDAPFAHDKVQWKDAGEDHRLAAGPVSYLGFSAACKRRLSSLDQGRGPRPDKAECGSRRERAPVPLLERSADRFHVSRNLCKARVSVEGRRKTSGGLPLW